MKREVAPAGDLDVVVAICTWNRCALLRQTLQSLAEMDVPAGVRWSVLVVNNRCTDDTDGVVREFVGRLPVRLVHENQPGLSHARNRALDECAAPYLLFTDDDVQLDNRWLTAFVRASRLFPQAAVFGGPVEPWFQAPPDPELLRWFPAVRNGFCGIDHGLPMGELPAPLRVTGANMAFRVAGLGDLRFDPSLGMRQTSLAGGEETAMLEAIRQQGRQAVWVPEMRLRHYVDPARLELPYLVRLTRDRAGSSVREKGIPRGRRIAGVPVWLWGRVLRARLEQAVATLLGRRIRAASHRAKAEGYLAKIAECMAMRQTKGRRSEYDSF